MKKSVILGLLGGGMGIFFMVLTLFDISGVTDKGIFANVFMTALWGGFMLVFWRILLKRLRSKSK